MTTDLLFDLNDAQRQAVTADNSPLLILAGAGSGKTRTLTYRIAHLIANGVPGQNILAVTFTNKAAEEMNTRMHKLINQTEAAASVPISHGRPTMGTFHSICARILRIEAKNLTNGFNDKFSIFDNYDSLKLIKKIMKERGINDNDLKPKVVSSLISGAKNAMLSPVDFASTHNYPPTIIETIGQLADIYQKRLVQHNAMDFDDLIAHVVSLWTDQPDILEKYQERWQYIFVDEYQDTNVVQYQLIKMLSAKYRQLCVVGDDHQSIYRFRGADYRNILEFEQDFADAQVIKLEQNYRSSKNILQHANSIISHNTTGRAKYLWTDNAPGEPLWVRLTSNEKYEARWIIERIQKLQTEGFSLSDMAILYRMNAQSRALEEAFLHAKMSYKIIGGVRFFDRSEVKDIMAYCRLIANPQDDLAFLRIVNTPSRKIGATTLDIIQQYSTQHSLSLFASLSHLSQISALPEGKKITLEKFVHSIDLLKKYSQQLPVSELLTEILRETQFLIWLDDGTTDGQNRQQNVQELKSVAQRYDEEDDSLGAFLAGVSLISDTDALSTQAHSVTLMTIHAAKGLEFPIIFLPGWEANIFPSANALYDDEQMEEERRLAYVALTRAQAQCHITYTSQRTIFGTTNFNEPSRFIAELDDKGIDHHQENTPEIAPVFGQKIKRKSGWWM